MINRSWKSFSLRALLVLMTLFAIVCGYITNDWREARRQWQAEQQAIDLLQRRGLVLQSEPSPRWWSGLLRSREQQQIFSRVVMVGSHNNRLRYEPTDAAAYASLTQLQQLDLSTTSADDSLLQVLPQLRQLETLDLSGTLVTGHDCPSLAGLTQLRELNLANTRFQPAAWRVINGLPKLEKLNLGSTQVDDAWVIELCQRQPHLQLLGLSKTKVTDQSMSAIASLRLLETLYLEQVSITNQGVQQLAKSRSLRCIDIGHNAIDDGCIAALIAMPSMKAISIHRCKFTAEGKAKVHQAIPPPQP
ncbi:hypothetical protein Psta_1522 [Pirellula staleyi DSM 6068]|uniref:Leucine Rich repeats (2 copies) n=1 Tax=Pirellula staleyi (strain ATCC 27377 / DSM 6068 / ICPB 4128) TaxID=530564 RepID=D2QXL2_PIRSD|nr:hypothetical protein [Pirellula staleyi]ADB16197.1 hypothetical protein Psta_1522 [Pirellula staleyi DSM 6068]